MNQMQILLDKIRDHISKDPNLTPEAVDDLFVRARDSLERLAFARILNEVIDDSEKEVYQELLSMDGEVDGLGFLEWIRSRDEAESIMIKYFGQEVHKFITYPKNHD